MLDHIRAHSITVEKVASIIARGLRDAGENLMPDKVKAGAWMHDIAKTLCLNTREDHAEKGREICLKHHLDEIADIVGEHIRLKGYQRDAPVSEKEVVYYADKRVNADVVVSLHDRLKYLLEHYGNGNALICRKITENFDLCREVERKLFAKLDFDPQDVAGLIEKE
ncbi:MAG: HD domain-containing protein [Proteobacteria bacterium]|nr:HD domain-containing protein [Pseudomonadota bacterium]